METSERTLRLMVVGDILIHMEIVRAARKKESYDFSMLFENMSDVFRQADILAGNMETILTDRIAPRGFPRFATPTAVGDAIERAGFDLVTVATNHALDMGAQGLADSAGFWKGKKAKAIGVTNRNEPFSPVVLERNGIRAAFLNYTDPTNYHFQPCTGDYKVELIRQRYKKAIRRQIEAARAAADFVVLLPHWGTEYLYEPNRVQESWAAFFAESGADIIVGAHPHVVQSTRIITTSDGRRVPCIYSLGNFISCQKRPATMLGALADITLSLDGSTGKKEISYDLLPLVAHTNGDCSYFSTYLLSDYSDELAGQSRVLKIVAQDYGATTSTASLAELFAAIQREDAQKDNPFQNSRQVRWFNIRRIIKLWLTRGKSAGR